MRLLEMRPIARAAGVLVVAAAIAATAFHFGRDGTAPAARPGAAAAWPKDPLARELARCRTIGMAAKDDAGCEAAWAESRRRFFSYAPTSDHLQPTNEEARKPNPEAK
jgi:conjugative transfer region protein TrbK